MAKQKVKEAEKPSSSWEHGAMIELPIDQLEANPWNPNEMTSDEFNMLSENVEEVGFLQPILVVPIIKEDGSTKFRIVDGEHRYEQQRLMDTKYIKCVIADPDKFDEKQQKRQTIRMNKIKGHFNIKKFAKLADEMMTIHNVEYKDLAKEFGFADEKEMDHLLTAARESLPSEEMKKDFDKARDEIKTVDELSMVLNRLFCYDEMTETLTDYGWIRWDQYRKGMKVAAFNPKTESISFEEPKDLHVFTVKNQKMFRIKGKSTDLLISPEHRMLYSPVNYDKDPDWRVVPIEEMLTSHSKYWFVSRIKPYEGETPLKDVIFPDGGVIPPDLFLKLVGWYLSEGHILHRSPAVGITQNVGEVGSEIEGSFGRLEACGYKVWGPHKYGKCQKMYIVNKSLFQWFIENCGIGSKKKRVPRQLLCLPVAQLYILFNALMQGDGSWRNEGDYGSYSSISEGLIDDVQEIAFKLGYKAVKYSAGGGLFTVSITSGTGKCLLRKEENITEELYDGIAYCFSVSTGLMVVRRNGVISIQGNTKYGDTIPYHFMVLDFGGKEHLWVRMDEKFYKRVRDKARECMAFGATFDSVLLHMLMLLDTKEFVEEHKTFLKEPDPATMVSQSVGDLFED